MAGYPDERDDDLGVVSLSGVARLFCDGRNQAPYGAAGVCGLLLLEWGGTTRL